MKDDEDSSQKQFIVYILRCSSLTSTLTPIHVYHCLAFCTFSDLEIVFLNSISFIQVFVYVINLVLSFPAAIKIITTIGCR